MSLTNFPNGITSFGVPVVGGGARFSSFWRGRVFFVDGTNGSNGNSGLLPTQAFSTLQAAVTAAATDDTIFIRPQAVGGRYTENVLVPVTTHAGLSIIGTGNGKGNSVYQACSIRGVLAVDSPILTLNSSYANIENLHFWSRAAQTTNGFAALCRWNTPVGLALNIGSAFVNCTFSADVDDAPAAAGATQPALRFDSTEGQLIENCLFMDCRIGISIGSTQSASYSMNIRNNQFLGTASNIAADIYMTDVNRVNTHNNTFGHGVPTHAAGTLVKYVYCAGTVGGQMTECTQGALDVAAATNNTLSNIICSGNRGLAGPWTS